MATAAHRWLTDPIYAPFHRPTGYIVAGSTPKAIEMLYEDDLPNMPNTVMYNSAQDFRKALSEEMFTGEFPGWKGFLDNNPGAGWVDSVRAVGAAVVESERLGVKYQVGKVNKLLYDSISQDVVGAVLEGGTEIRADYTILCAGAYSSQIVELHDEIHAVAWVVAHIKLSDTELEAFKGMPVLWSNNLGFMTPPDARTKELKICDQHSGYVSRVIQDGKCPSLAQLRVRTVAVRPIRQG
jgi:sarcosine oxidase/L-pipecolate oxidase